MTRMIRNKEYWPLYVASVVAWIGIFVVPIQVRINHFENLEADRFYQDIPTTTFEQAHAAIASVNKLADVPTSDPKDYYDALKRLRSVEMSMNKAGRGPWSEDVMRIRSLYTIISPTTSSLMRAYQEKLGTNVMAEASAKYLDQRTAYRIGPGMAAETPALYWSMYLSSIPFALFWFLLRLDANGFSILIEILTFWRLALATVLWPIGLFKYPNGDPARQVMAGLRFATLTLGTAIAGFAGVAKAETNNGSSKRNDDTGKKYSIMVDSDEAPATPADPPKKPMFTTTVALGYSSSYVGAIAKELYHGSVFRQSITMSHNRSGIYGYIWNSIGGPKRDYGHETDYALGIARRVGPVAADLSVYYFNLVPLNTRRGDLYDVLLDATVVATPVRPYVNLGNVIGRNPDVLRGGVTWRVGIRPRRGPVAFDISVAGHDGIGSFKPDPMSSGRVTISTTRTICQKVIASPFLSYQTHLGPAGGIAVTRWFGGLSLSRSF